MENLGEKEILKALSVSGGESSSTGAAWDGCGAAPQPHGPGAGTLAPGITS